MPRRKGLSPLQISRVLDAKRVGAHNKDACAHAGISYSALYLWLGKGRKATSGKYFEFNRDFLEAEAMSVMASLVTIAKASKTGTWHAAAWVLERTRPHEYSLRPERFMEEARIRRLRENDERDAIDPTARPREQAQRQALAAAGKLTAELLRIASGESTATQARLKAIERALALAGLGTPRQVDLRLSTHEDGTAIQVGSLSDSQLATVERILASGEGEE